MTVTITLPPAPRLVPDLTADPASIRSYAADLLAGSAQVDDLGTFVATDARIGDWTGQAAISYHGAIRSTGRQADAMSVALRGVSRRVDAHADRMEALEERRTSLVAERSALLATITDLLPRAGHAMEEDTAAIQSECDDCARRVRGYESDLDLWATDVIAEEEAMRAAFERVLTLEQVEQRYAGVADPADGALAAIPPAGSSPETVTDWWDGLAREEQLGIIAASPGSIGNRDGIPPWARDEANTVALDRDVAEWGHLEDIGEITDDEQAWLENARAAQHAIDTIADGIDPVTREPVATQLHSYDPGAFAGDGAVAISAGSLDTADNVAVVVPGFGTDGGSAPYLAERALTIYEATRFLDPSQTTATMLWIGYDAPDNAPWDADGDGAGVLTEEHAAGGGARLADTLDGLRASRHGEPAHMTAIGHSYGSTTTGHAAHDEGIPVDDLIFVGSPGVGGDTDDAADTGIDPGHVWAGANSRDPIANLGNLGWLHGETVFGAGLGDDPTEDAFGGNRFRAESTTRADDSLGLEAFDDHAKYFDHDTESLYNISQVVTGNHDAVVHAEHVHDRLFQGPRDPEFERAPTSPATQGAP